MTKKRIPVCALFLMVLLMIFPLCVSAAAPTVQEVESLIASIGTVSRENRTAVEQAVNAYYQLDEAAKSQVSNYAVLAEAQQILGIQDALAKLTHEHDNVDEIDTWFSPLVEGNDNIAMVPAIYFDYFDGPGYPIMALMFYYEGDDFITLSSAKVRTDGYRYTLGSFDFIDATTEIKDKKIIHYSYGFSLVEEFEYNMLLDVLDSEEVIVRLIGNAAQKLPVTVDYTLTESDYEAINDTMYAYHLMCQADYSTLLKAIA